MAGLTPTQIDDLVASTFNMVQRKSWIDLSVNSQEYTVARFMSRKDAAISWGGGPRYEWKLQVANDRNARWSMLFDSDQTSINNLLVTATVDMRKMTTNFSYDVDESAFNSGNMEQILDYIAVREHSCQTDSFELLETAFWSAPASSSVTPMPMVGVPFYVQSAGATTNVGFNGLNPAGFAAGCGNVSAITYPNWANINGLYTTISTADLITKINRAMSLGNFIPPDPYKEIGGGGPGRYGFYTTLSIRDEISALMETRNDNLGYDFKFREPLFGRMPVEWAPRLDSRTDGPFYGIDWKHLQMVFLKGRQRQRSNPIVAQGQHTVRVVHEDSWMELICRNRRSQFVLTTS
jgi:hypothetical protein